MSQVSWRKDGMDLERCRLIDVIMTHSIGGDTLFLLKSN
jgi:hypothetical protein